MANATDKDPKDKTTPDTAPAVNPPVSDADVESEEKTEKLDETVPGGKYIVGDNFVDAEGKVLHPVEVTGKKATKKTDK